MVMSDFVLTRTGAVVDFRPMAEGSWALVYSDGSWIPWTGLPGDLLGSRALSESEALRLTSPEAWLSKRSQATFNLLVEKIRDTKIITSMFDCYAYYRKMYGEKRKRKPRLIAQSDIDRLLFEILCFATFIIVVRAVPAYIRGKFVKRDDPSNSRNVRYFGQTLLECLEKFLKTHKITSIKELDLVNTRAAVQYGSTGRLSSARRLACYLEMGSIEEELRLFSSYAGQAIDVLNPQVTEIIALSHTGMIMDAIARTLDAVFKGQEN